MATKEFFPGIVDVTNQNGDLIATFESSVFWKDQKVPFEVQE